MNYEEQQLYIALMNRKGTAKYLLKAFNILYCQAIATNSNSNILLMYILIITYYIHIFIRNKKICIIYNAMYNYDICTSRAHSVNF